MRHHGATRAERELESTAAILETEHESSQDGILVVDRKARVLSVNRRLAEIFCVPDELIASRDYPALLAAATQRLADAEAHGRRVAAFLRPS